MSRTVAVVQARMGSTRLPGKVLADVGGCPLLARVLERVGRIPGVDAVVLATTTAALDDALVPVAAAADAQVFRGSVDDVLDRYYEAARTAAATAIVRVTGDCPLIDPQVSGRVVAAYHAANWDYVSNVQPRRYPDGLDTEVFSFAALEHAWLQARLPSDREHVTPYIWKRPDEFRLGSVVGDVDHSMLRWTVDDARDLEFVRAVFQRLDRQGATIGMDDVIDLLRRDPGLAAINAGIATNEGYSISLARDAAPR